MHYSYHPHCCEKWLVEFEKLFELLLFNDDLFLEIKPHASDTPPWS